MKKTAWFSFVLSVFVAFFPSPFYSMEPVTRAGLVPAQLDSSEFRANRKGARNLLILVSNWKYALSPLRGPRNDSELLAGFFSRHSTGLGKYRVEKLANLNYSEFRRKVSRISEAGLENLVFHYSGHGRFDRGKTYLLMPDMEEQSDLSDYPAVSQERVLSLLRGFKARRTLMIFDMCDSGADQRSGQNLAALRQGGEEYRKMLESSEGVWQINAARNAAYESRYGKPASYYGDLSWNLVEGLREGRADGIRGDTKKDGLISVEEIFYFVQRNIKKQMPSSPLKGTGVFPFYEYENPERDENLTKVRSLLKKAEKNQKVSALLEAITVFSDLKERYLLGQAQAEIESVVSRLRALSDNWTEKVVIEKTVSHTNPLYFPPRKSSRPIGPPPASAKARELFERAKDLSGKCLKWERTSKTRAYEYCKEALRSLDEIMEREPESDLAVKILLGDLSVEGFDRGELEAHVAALQERKRGEGKAIEKLIGEIEELVSASRTKKTENPVQALYDLKKGWKRVENLMQTYTWADQVAALGSGERKIVGSTLNEVLQELESLRASSMNASRKGARKANVILVEAYKAIRSGKELLLSDVSRAHFFFKQAIDNLERLKKDFNYTQVGRRVAKRGFKIEGFDLPNLRQIRDKALEEKQRLVKEKVLLARVLSIPAKKYMENLEGYKELLKLDPASQYYKQKIAHYKKKIKGTLRKYTNTIGMEFVLIPADRFQMDSNYLEPAGQPQYEAKISRPYYLGKFEVTQDQWEAIMGSNPSIFTSCGINCPVEMVSWTAVQEFINKLNNREGCSMQDTASIVSSLRLRSVPAGCYRLPTEEEWKYAATAGNKKNHHWAERFDCSKIMKENSTSWSNARCIDYLKQQGFIANSTAPVGSYEANDWDIYDMSGNVWEWVMAYNWDHPSNQTIIGGGWDDLPRGGPPKTAAPRVAKSRESGPYTHAYLVGKARAQNILLKNRLEELLEKDKHDFVNLSEQVKGLFLEYTQNGFLENEAYAELVKPGIRELYINVVSKIMGFRHKAMPRSSLPDTSFKDAEKITVSAGGPKPFKTPGETFSHPYSLEPIVSADPVSARTVCSPINRFNYLGFRLLRVAGP
jgi:formylglycine-generating enzyme required for sulfatase activity